MHARRLITAVTASLAVAVPAALSGHAAARPHRPAGPPTVPGRVVVGYRTGVAATARVEAAQAAGAQPASGEGATPSMTVLNVGRGSVAATISKLRRDKRVAYAVPDYVAHAADFIPDDTGNGGTNGWEKLQWNFIGPWGVNAPAAWDIARHSGGPGGRGVVVAVVDSGVAFENYGRFRRAPDFYSGGFVDPWDFIKHNRHPDDEESHGTHVTGTIFEKTNNHFGLTGLAYDVRIMPLRVLDANGDGDGSSIAAAILYAVKHHARVVNMSVEFDTSLHASDIPEVISAIRYATRHGVVLVAAAGNEGISKLSYPARDSDVISVGASTVDGCLADYSNFGPGIDLVAPGGGQDASLSGDPMDDANCNPDRDGREVFQETFTGSPRRFALIGYEGTSFATPHVTAAVALLLATHRLGARPSPAAVKQRLMQTARDLGPAGYDPHYGAGLLNLAAALGP